MKIKKSDLAVFEKLKTLVGRWRRDDDSEPESIDFRLSALGTVLVETWIWPDRGIEALTLYHMDGDQLMATHYCPLGNQPKFLLASQDNDARLVFAFDSATNLSDHSVPHCVEFWMQLENNDAFTRSETYTESDGLDLRTNNYRRTG